MSNSGSKKTNDTSHPFYFGMYFNRARLNAYITLCHISDLLGVGVVENEDCITEMKVIKILTDQSDQVKSQRAFELINERFPVLGVICDSGRSGGKEIELSERMKKYAEVLLCLLEAIKLKRNEYCHAYHKPKEIEQGDLIRHLEKVFEAAVRKVKGLRSLDEKDVLHLRRKISEGNGRNKRMIDNPDFHHQFKDDNGITEKGLAFLVCMFLEKRDAYLYLKQLAGFKKGETPRDKATLETYCVYRMRIPKPVMTSDSGEVGLALDMFNELQKCPGKMFNVLSEDRQKEFRVVNKEEQDNYDFEILLKRYSDRFPQLALAYCDEKGLFKDIRFQIDLGRYYFKLYDKNTIDGNIRARSLDKRLKTFGRLKEVKVKVRDEWADIIKAPDEVGEDSKEPYKTNSTPRYNIVDKQIGFKIEGDRGLPGLNAPNGKIVLEKPDAWFSMYELAGMIFYGKVFGFEKAERLLIQYVKNQREICEYARDNGSLPAGKEEFVPRALEKFNAGGYDCSKYQSEKLKRLIKDTGDRIKAFRTTKERMADKSNKPGKRRYFDIRAGKLADFLAKDMLVMQPFDKDKDGADKITSLDYQVLQATLAMYGANRDVIVRVFEKAGLYGGENPHPFLKNVKVAGYKSIAQFYESYLVEKLNFLERCKSSGSLSEFQFLRPSRACYANENHSIKTVADRLLDAPVNIPSNFFCKHIEAYICQKRPELKGRDMNTAYMIKTYFEREYGSSQPFYDYTRTYPVVTKAHNYIKDNGEIKRVLGKISAEMSYKELRGYIENKIPDNGRYKPEELKKYLLDGCKEFKKQERDVRRYNVQDMALFMLAEGILKEQLSVEGDIIKLEDLVPKKKSSFKVPVICSTKIEVRFNAKPKHFDVKYVDFIQRAYRGKFVCEKNKLVLKYEIRSENTKLKDLGKYRRYLYDRRLGGLLVWKYEPNAESDAEICYSEIEKEIAAYEQYGKDMVSCLYGMECRVIDKLMSKEKSECDYIPFWKIVERLVDTFDKLEEFETLKDIRNALNHNQFPAFTDGVNNEPGELIAEKMLSAVKRCVERVEELLLKTDGKIKKGEHN